MLKTEKFLIINRHIRKYLSRQRTVPYPLYHEWTKADPQNDPQWGIKRYYKYNFGPVLGLYSEKDQSLIDVLNNDFSDEELCALLIPIKERALNELLEAENDLILAHHSNIYESFRCILICVLAYPL